jgi:hypothetical protein
MESSLFHTDLLTGHEPEMVGVPVVERITTIADRGSLAPQRGEGSRVRGEIVQVVENQQPLFSSSREDVLLRMLFS